MRNLVSKTFKIQIKGRVQGVGFRPFVFNLAKEHQLNGSVSNNEEGVIIYCNTSEEKATQFLEQILLNKPEIAVITAHSTDEVPLIKFDDFSIVITKTSAQINLPLTPDFAICENCKAEISDSGNRRYNYAFTTCVHCGPRYAITQKFPFERAHTSLTEFDMCSTCLEEYTNPTNRRFHSQTNSCKSCGIQLQLVTNLGETIAINQLECIEKSAKRLIEGNILAIKNTNGYVFNTAKC